MKDKIRVTITIEGKDYYIWMPQEDYNNLKIQTTEFDKLIFKNK